MLPGTLYPKKTHGRSLFVGEFKQHVTVPPASESQNVLGASGKPDEQNDASTDVNQQTQVDSVKVTQKTLTYGENKGEKNIKEEDVKVIWKKAGSASAIAKPKKGAAAKAFFTPASSESRDTDTEQVVDLPVTKEEDGEAKKRKKPNTPPQQISPRKNIPPRQIHFPLKTRLVAKTKDQTSSPKVERDKTEEVETAEEKPTEKEETKEQPEEAPDEHQPTDDKTKSKPEVPKPSKSSTEGHDSGESDHESQEQDSVSTDDKQKAIVIKPNQDLAGFAQKLESEQEETLSVLRPDAVEDIKRDLAQKGIIVLPPSEVLPTVPEGNETSEESSHAEDGEGEQDEEGIDDKESLDADDATGEGASDKLERKEGFKTNKSFEIRRLQAKAERERENKRALFGRRFPKLRMKSESPTKPHPPYQRERRSRTLKSALKPATPPSGDETGRGILKSPSPLPGKVKISVRIRDPEYDYQEYTDVELESDSMDSGRANSFLSFSDLDVRSECSSDSSTYSTTTFNESPSELSQSDDDRSLQGSALHRLYDEIDTLSPSRQSEYIEMMNREIDSRDSKRSRSAMSRVTRSSLHLPVKQVPPNQLVESYMEAYQDRPMNLFDSMRHESLRQSSRDRQRRRDKRRVSFVEEEGTRRQMDPTSGHNEFAVENETQTPRHHRQPGEMAVAFGPTIIPIGTRQGYTRREWKRRVEKFFETSYANRDHTKSRRKGGNTPVDLNEGEPEFSGNCACCRNRCRPLYDMLDCSKKSTISHILWLFLPTVVFTVLLCILLFIAADIIPLGGATNNSTDFAGAASGT